MKIVRPTPAQVREALEEHAHRREDGTWWFGESPHYLHAEDGALAIVEACLTLGMPVTDVLSAKSWLTVVRAVADLHRRLDELTDPPAFLLTKENPE